MIFTMLILTIFLITVFMMMCGSHFNRHVNMFGSIRHWLIINMSSGVLDWLVIYVSLSVLNWFIFSFRGVVLMTWLWLVVMRSSIMMVLQVSLDRNKCLVHGHMMLILVTTIMELNMVGYLMLIMLNNFMMDRGNMLMIYRMCIVMNVMMVMLVINWVNIMLFSIMI